MKPTQELDEQRGIRIRDGEKRVNARREILASKLDLLLGENLLTFPHKGKWYAIQQGCLWRATRELTHDDWLVLIGETIKREDAKLKSLHASKQQEALSRRAISSEVRIAV